jgi:predicted O-methyltransferase YrrM
MGFATLQPTPNAPMLETKICWVTARSYLPNPDILPYQPILKDSEKRAKEVITRSMMPSMTYKVFFSNFGTSLRSRNARRWDAHWASSDWVRNTAGRWLRSKRNGLPSEFIRLDPWEAEYLYCVARRARKGIVEIGRFQGGSTFLLACANPNVVIHSIDIAPKDDGQLLRFFSQHRLGENVKLIVGDSRLVKCDSIGEFDVLFIDGDHSYQGCRADLDKWFGPLSKDGHVVVHDSFLDKPVQDAVADFIEQNHNAHIVVSPFIGASHWRYPTGSLAHLQKT